MTTMKTVEVGRSVRFGNDLPLTVIAGPCQLESRDHALMIAEAAKTLASEEQALQVRYLQTLTEIAGDKSWTIVFPLDLVEKVKKALD